MATSGRRQALEAKVPSALAILALVGFAACSDPKAPQTPGSSDATAAASDAPVFSQNDLGPTDATDAASPGTDADAASIPDDASTSADSLDSSGAACPGGGDCPCSTDAECDIGLCLQTPEGKRCAVKCSVNCPKGFQCKSVGGADPVFACLPTTLALCAPCQEDKGCSVLGIDSRCLDYGTEGRFCGAPCSDDSACPDDYTCQDLGVEGGVPVKQCKRKAGAGVCPCSVWAVSGQATTACATSNAAGSCKGTRSCVTAGSPPSACNAKTPAAETCNASDDDCNGVVDDLAAEVTCSKAAYQPGGSGLPCATDGDCATPGEACVPEEGKCRPLIGKCPGKPLCSAAGGFVCADAKTPKLEQCNGEDDDCDGLVDEGFGVSLASDPSTVFAVGQACGAGICGAGKVVCKTLDSAACSSSDKAKVEVCNGVDDDCNGLTDDQACDDKDLCTTDLCAGSQGVCSHPAGVDCDDGNPCSKDTCGPGTGTCAHEAYLGSCSDGNACTVGDTCQPGGSALPGCAPGTQALNCDDANACTDDSCDPSVGCVHLPNSATQSCYGGAATTAGVGPCHAGVQTCNAGQKGECLGAVLPTAEACNTLDDDCNGITDEGCKAADAQIAFAGATFTPGSSGGTQVWGFLAPSVPVGDLPAGSQKTSAWLGLFGWLMQAFK